MTIQTQILTHIKDFEPFRSEWDELCRSGGYGAFVFSDWIIAWHNAFACEKTKPLIAIALEDGELVAGIAMTIRNRPVSPRLKLFRFKTLTFRSTDHAGFHEMIVKKDQPSLAADLCRVLVENIAFQTINLCPMRESRELEVFISTARTLGFFVDKAPEFKNDWVEIGNGWDKFLQDQPRRLRKDTRKCIAKAQTAGLSLDITSQSSEKDNIIVERILDLSRLSWKAQSKTDIGHSPKENLFFRELFKGFSRSEQATFFCLEIDGKDAASLVALRSNNCVYGVLSDFNEEMSEYAPGKLILLLMIEYFSAKGVTCVQCLRSTPMTRRLANDQETLYRVFIAKQFSLASVIYRSIKLVSPIGKRARKSKQLRTKKRSAYKDMVK